MNVSSIGAPSAASTRSTDGMNAMQSDDFFELLVTELRNQDPFQPNETSDMISQVSQIRSIEVSDQLGRTLSTLTDEQRSLGAAELIGKYVSGRSEGPDGQPTSISGVVSEVRFASDGSATLKLENGQTIRAVDVESVAARPPGDAPPSPTVTAGAQHAADDAAVAPPRVRWGIPGLFEIESAPVQR